MLRLEESRVYHDFGQEMRQHNKACPCILHGWGNSPPTVLESDVPEHETTSGQPPDVIQAPWSERSYMEVQAASPPPSKWLDCVDGRMPTAGLGWNSLGVAWSCCGWGSCCLAPSMVVLPMKKSQRWRAQPSNSTLRVLWMKRGATCPLLCTSTWPDPQRDLPHRFTLILLNLQAQWKYGRLTRWLLARLFVHVSSVDQPPPIGRNQVVCCKM